MNLDSSRPNLAETRFHRACFIGAVVITLLWAFVYIGWQRGGLVDEPGQMEVIYHFFLHRPGIPEELPSLPGYHFAVLGLTLNHPSMTTARLVTLGFSLLGLLTFAGAWRQLHGQPAGGATLLFALLPILQPYTAMVYTDMPAVAVLCAGFWAHFARRPLLAAFLFLLACLIRQTCLVWVAYLAVWEFLRVFFPSNSDPFAVANNPAAPRFTQWLKRSGWLLLLLGIAAAIVIYAGRLTLGHAHGNKPEPNIATLHFGGVLFALLALPAVLLNARRIVGQISSAFRLRTLLSCAALILALVGIFVLAKTFRNPHGWNRELYWLEPPSTFILVRNWPLVWIERLPWLTWVSATLMVGGAAGLALLFSSQRFARELWLSVPFGLALLLSNGLVEPRYFITPLVVLLLLLEYPSATLRWQVRWFAVLCLMHAPFIVTGLSLW